MIKLIGDTLKQALRLVYRVGDIKMTVNPTNPADYYGFGTWTLWGAGSVPVGVNTSDTDFSTVEKTGGEKTSSHYHWMTMGVGDSAIEYMSAFPTQSDSSGHSRVVTGSMYKYLSTSGGSAGQSGSRREDGTHDTSVSTVQPYITCYMWKRTA
ncbi:MAG: hypothetical protein LBQ21_07410 [Clostridiales Family XIII bacterium]|jgi:hypothetical protein|nr:hypothetical protein [Clostridiales Family XIII bacterium]